MLTIYTNSVCIEEKKYIFHQIFNVFLDLDYQLRVKESIIDIEIIKEGKKLVINSFFFEQFKEVVWLSNESRPKEPLKRKNLNEWINFDLDNIPVIYGDLKIEFLEKSVKLGIDIFGSCFFMLSRYEEFITTERDVHGRFPVKESIAYKEGFLMTPIVDLYVELLWSSIKYLWPDMERKVNKCITYISCDIDHLSDKGVCFPGIVKRLAADLIRRRSFSRAFKSLKLFYKVSILGRKDLDPYNTFDFMMDECEKKGLKMAFYFIPRNNKAGIDGDYDIESQEVISLMRRVIERGHEVGYHASYYSYNNMNKTLEELTILKKVYEQAGGDPNDIKGGRQHYLRWKTGVTENNWEEAGLEYDTTLGFAEHIGFRCGTSKEYNFYSLNERRALTLKVRPLLVMEATLLTKQYMGLSRHKVLEKVKTVKSQVELYQGNYSLLWHNSSFGDDKDKELFEKCI